MTAVAGVEKDAAPKLAREPVSAAAAVRTDIVFFHADPSFFILPSRFPVFMQQNL